MAIIESRVIPEDPKPTTNLEIKSCQKETLIALSRNISDDLVYSIVKPDNKDIP